MRAQFYQRTEPMRNWVGLSIRSTKSNQMHAYAPINVKPQGGGERADPGEFDILMAATEMPTSGDLKPGDCLFFYFPPGISTTPPRKIDSTSNRNDLGHYRTSYMTYILSKFECEK